MRRFYHLMLGLIGFLSTAAVAHAQVRPYIGFAYPAGGRQGTTVQIRLGGQGLDGVDRAMVSGAGVEARVVEYHRRMGPLEMQLMREQIAEIKRIAAPASKPSPPAAKSEPAKEKAAAAPASAAKPQAGSKPAEKKPPEKPAPPPVVLDPASAKLVEQLEARIAEYAQRPACNSIANLVLVEIRIAADALPGQRELTVATPRGVSNPLVFHVGQLPEVARKPMVTAEYQVLGKEELALRKRPDDEIEKRITLPCTANGQIASGEVNRYRFEATQGQRLVFSAVARQLVPYIADAVPGWFQPVMTLCDSKGRELAYSDDFRFNPDPTIYYEVPRDGEYVLSIADALYRGREDFVYRVSMGELPFVTSIFPLGGRAGTAISVEMKGWNLDGARIAAPGPDAPPQLYALAAGGADSLVSNRVPFALDTLPEALEEEPNNDVAHAQQVDIPVIINGRIDRPDDWDVFRIDGRAGEMIVAEVRARRLDSPLDSFLKVTDADGKLLALNDDHDGTGYGLNTHHADSYLVCKLPAAGPYYIHIGDTTRHGGEEYAYRLRISPPQPDFSLYVVPSSSVVRSKSSNAVSVYAVRKDGFNGPIALTLRDPPPGFSARQVTMAAGQSLARLAVKTDLADAGQSVSLVVQGSAIIEGRGVMRNAVPAEDRMQAFLWRHLVPAEDLEFLVFDPAYQPAPKRPAPVRPPPPETKPAATSTDASATKPKFTKQQVEFRLRQLKLLYEEGLLTDAFYDRKVAECEVGR